MAPGIQFQRPNSPPPANAFQAAGSWLVVFFLFISYSRIFDFALSGLHVPLVASSIALLFCILSGGLQRALSNRVGLLLTAFTIWFVLAIPFGLWKGGSVAVFRSSWLKSFLLFVVVAGLIGTLRQCCRAMYSIAFAVLVVSFICFYHRATIYGRLMLRQGLLENPNDLAQVLLMGIPFWLLIAMNGAGIPFRRPIAALCTVPIIIATIVTGSRGALVAISAMMLAMFLYSSSTARLKLIGAGFILVPAILVLSPRTVLHRYGGLFGAGNTSGIEDIAAVESKAQRWFLLKQSIKITLHNPLLGVGPGNFEVASTDDAHSRGIRAPGRVTHNAYTQVSSEEGIPALIFYVAALVYCIRQSTGIFKITRGHPALTQVSSTAFCMLLSLMSLAVSAMFASIAYQFFFPTLAGLMVAFARVAQEEIRAVRIEQPSIHGVSIMQGNSPIEAALITNGRK